jgi:hypothetical protein
LLVTLAFAATAARATELTVDARSITIDDSVMITLSLDGDFAELGTSPQIPLQNLVMDGVPSSSSSISWINGTFTRKRELRYQAHAVHPGAAMVGPLMLVSSNGQRLQLPAIAIDVRAGLVIADGDPIAVLRDLARRGKDPICLAVDIDRKRVLAGEELVVTWNVYSAVRVQQYRFGDFPPLPDFWVEEIDVHDEAPDAIRVGDAVVQKVPLRRVALFPLRPGSFTIAPMQMRATILKRMDDDDGSLRLFNGMLVDITRNSPPVTIESLPISGGAVDAVGDVSLRCTPPMQRNGGPIAFDISVAGRANLRTMAAPRFEGKIDGTPQIADQGIELDRTRDAVLMTHRWRYLVFPARSGPVTIPAIVMSSISPAGERRTLRCEGATLRVSAAPAPSPATPPPAAPRSLPSARTPLRERLPWLLAILAFVLASAGGLLHLRAGSSIRRRARRLTVDRAPAEVRDAVHALLQEQGLDARTLLDERSERGDAYRAFRSLSDALERERLTAAKGELRDRVADLLRAIG